MAKVLMLVTHNMHALLTLAGIGVLGCILALFLIRVMREKKK